MAENFLINNIFESDIFETWLDEKSKELVKKIGNGDPLWSEEMIILVLKAQSNHFAHLDVDMQQDMKDLRIDMDKRFEQVFARMDRFMFWSLGLTITSTLFILGFLKFGL